MTIDGVNIYSFGMFLKDTPAGLYDIPARKKTTAIDGTAAKDIVYAERDISVELFAEYADFTTLKTGVNGLNAALRGAEKTFVFPNYSKTIIGHVTKGASFDTDGLLVEAKFKIQVTG